jgi:hypothetical protein
MASLYWELKAKARVAGARLAETAEDTIADVMKVVAFELAHQ